MCKLLDTNDHEININRYDKIEDLIKKCNLQPKDVASIKNNGQEYRDNMEELIVKTSLSEPFEIGKIIYSLDCDENFLCRV